MIAVMKAVGVLVAALALTACGTTATVDQVVPAAATTPGAAVAALAQLPVRALGSAAGYTRAAFLPHGWADPDGNGCDARRDTLARQAVGTPVFAGAHHCVFTATITDPYTGDQVLSTKTDVDHVVALGDVWRTGGAALTGAQREALANDPTNLIATTASLNRSKGEKDAAGWLPPRGQCPYVARQVAVKARYGLWVTPAEHDAIANVLAACPTEPLPG